MKKLFLVTGANGHLGSTIIRLLDEKKEEVRALILPEIQDKDKKNIHYYHGDVRDKKSLYNFFCGLNGYEVTVIHTAGIIDISDGLSQALYDVNVNGTKNIIELCKENKVKRLVYVSSVHAIPEKGKAIVLKETDRFSMDSVKGGYAKTKAEATRLVLEAARKGMNAVIVHPSGILGPYDNRGNHMVQLIFEYLDGKLPACVKGGYDFVDVRDVAAGCIMAAEKGYIGECYILSNQYCEISEILELARKYGGGKRLLVCPVCLAKIISPLIRWDAIRKNKRPLYTSYSLHVLESEGHFSHEKASKALGYHPRPIEQTVRDTVKWYFMIKNKEK